MFKSQEIAELQGRISKLEAELKTATDGQARIEAELATAKTDLEAANTKAATQEATILDLQGKLKAAEDAKAAAEASVDAKVTERLAAAGVDPVKRDPSAKTTETGKPAATVLTGIAKARAALAEKHGKN